LIGSLGVAKVILVSKEYGFSHLAVSGSRTAGASSSRQMIEAPNTGGRNISTASPELSMRVRSLREIAMPELIAEASAMVGRC
jgi:hypothetical protein